MSRIPNIPLLLYCFISWVFLPTNSKSLTITPNVESIKKIPPFYITPDETQQLHLNNFFSGYNLQYSLLYNASNCLPSLEISQSYRLLSESNTINLSSKGFIWSFYKDNSNFKRKIVGLDKINNVVLTADLELGSNLTNFILFANLSQYNLSCQHFITFKNQTLLGVYCLAQNTTEYLFLYNRSNQTQYLGGPFSFQNSQPKNKSNIRFVFNEGDAFYFIRFWLSPASNSSFEVWIYNNTIQNITLFKTLDKSTFGLATMELLDVRVHEGKTFFSEKSARVVMFVLHSSGNIDVYNQYSVIPINKIWIYEYGLITKSLYIAMISVGYDYILIGNWTDPNNPILLERYSILPIYNDLYYISFNEDFLIYYAKRDNNSQYFTVYKRGQKLLKNIYMDIRFEGNQTSTLFEFIPETNNLVVFTGSILRNYLLYDPILKINVSNITLADSYDDCKAQILINSSYPGLSPNYSETNITIKILNSDDTNLYTLKEETRNHSYIDYPGQVEFDLDQYYVGPNITYKLTWWEHDNNSSKASQVPPPPPNFLSNPDLEDDGTEDVEPAKLQSPLFRINKINQLMIDSLQTLQIDPTNIIYQNMVSSPLNISILIWFLQVSNYTLYVVQCKVQNIENSPVCGVQGNINSLGALIVNMTLAYKENLLWFAIKLETNLYDIQFFNTATLKKLDITLPIGTDVTNQVQDFTIMDFKIILCQPLRKTIVIIDLNAPNSILFSFDDGFMKANYNYSYFSPMRVKSQYFHKNILFVSDKVSVFIIDISNVFEGEIIIIKKIESRATKKLGNSLYYLSISKKTLLILSKYPETIEEYSLSNYNLIYKRKDFPLYNFSIVLSPNSFDFNDFEVDGGFLFIHAFDQNSNAYILIYKTAAIAHNVLYGIIPLNTKFPLVYVQTAGINTMYLAIINSPSILFYQVYRNATLIMNLLEIIVEKIKNDQMNFNITINNTFKPSSVNISYQLTTWDSGVNISLKDPKSNLPQTIIQLKEGYPQRIEISPNSMFIGSIISYSITCDSDCGKVSNATKLLKPISLSQTLMGVDEYTDLDFREDGFMVQTSNSLVKYDGKFQKTGFAFNFSPDSKCLKMIYHPKSNFTVVACKKLAQNYILYLIDSDLKTVLDNFTIPIDNIAALKIHKNYLVVLNAAEDEDQLDSFESCIFVYEFNEDNKTLHFLDSIDSDDAELNHLIVSGMDIGESDHNDTFRLFILDRYQGLRIVDFNFSNYKQKTQYSLNILNYVETDGVDKDYTVQFSAVKVVETRKKPETNTSIFSLIISTTNFHIYEITLEVNETAENEEFLKVEVIRCYWRYGFYSASNKIYTSANNSRFFVIPYVLDNDLMIDYSKYSKQILILFDRFNTNYFNRSNGPIIRAENPKYNYSVLLGGYVINTSLKSGFAKMQECLDGNETIYTFIYNNPLNQTIDQLILRPNISIVFEKPYSNDTQLTLTLKNDYSVTNITFIINEEDRSDSVATKEWIIGLVVALLVVAVILIFVVKKYGKSQDQEDDLMENEEENEGN